MLTFLSLTCRHLSTSNGRRSDSPHLVNEASISQMKCDSEAVKGLSDTLRVAADLHEKYTSEYVPDDRSIRLKRDLALASDECSSPLFATPPSGEQSSSHSTQPLAEVYDDSDNDNDMWPLEILSSHIAAYRESANKELEQGHYNQAEVKLQSAIQYAEMRERHYQVPFDNRTSLQEDVAALFQKQGKHAEAIAKVHQLLRDCTDEMARARQNQLLASIYHDRYQHRGGPALSDNVSDIEIAEKHARRAFNTRFKLLNAGNLPSDELTRHNSCILLLVRILEIRDKTVEAKELKKLLNDDTSTASDSLRRISTSHQSNDYIVVEDKHTLLIDAIKSGDNNLIENLLNDEDLNIERPCRQGKTPLMWAVEVSDESTVHRLLDPAVGADVDNANKKGLTALHYAAGLGLHDMVQCLLVHDADIGIKDKKGETPLVRAVQNNQVTVVQILCDRGADPEAKGVDEWSLLHYAIHLSNVEMIHQLIDIAPALGDAVDLAGKTALHHCAEQVLIDQAAALLRHKQHVDVNALDATSRSALYFAASRTRTPQRESMVRLLIDHDAHFNDARPPPKHLDYVALKKFQIPRRASGLSRHDSVSTEGTIDTVDTTSTSRTKLSRIFSARMHMR